MTSCILSDHSVIKFKINRKRNPINTQTHGDKHHTINWDIEEIKKEIFKMYTIYKPLGYSENSLERGLVPLSFYI